MALLSVSASSCLLRASLGPVAQRNVSSIEGGAVSAAPSTSRRQQGTACLASSASCQVYGGSGLAWRGSSTSRRQARIVQSVGIRCEQSTDGGASNSLDIWIGRAAMLGFVAAIGVEIATGKGVLESAGITAPVPTVALGLTAVVGAVTAFGVFRSTARD